MLVWFCLCYAGIAVVTAVAVYLFGRRAVDARRPPAHRIGLSVAAGLLWPVVLLGLVQLSSVVAYTKAHRDEPGIGALG